MYLVKRTAWAWWFGDFFSLRSGSMPTLFPYLADTQAFVEECERERLVLLASKYGKPKREDWWLVVRV